MHIGSLHARPVAKAVGPVKTTFGSAVHRQIGEDYRGKHTLLLGVLKGGFMFTVSLVAILHNVKLNCAWSLWQPWLHDCSAVHVLCILQCTGWLHGVIVNKCIY